MSGMCHALALVLHRRTGCPMVAIRGTEGGEDCVAHVAVEHPGDPLFAVDVRGVRPLSEMVEAYHDLDDPWTDLVSEGDLADWIDEGALHLIDAADTSEADRVADHILALAIPVAPPEPLPR